MIILSLQIVISLLIAMMVQSMTTIHLPPSPQIGQISIRLNQLKQIQLPQLPLKKIYSKQIYKVQNDTLVQFGMCKENKPEISFKNVGYFRFSQVQQNTNRVISDYQLLKTNYHNIVDMLVIQDYIYTINSWAILNIYKINSYSETGIQHITQVKAIDWNALKQQIKQKQQEQLKNVTNQPNSTFNNSNNQTSNPQNNSSTQQNPLIGGDPSTWTPKPPTSQLAQYLSPGFFIRLPSSQLILFLNNKYIIGINIRTSKSYLFMIINYQTFQTGVAIDQQHFALLNRQQGIIIYNITKDNYTKDNDGYQIQLENTITKQYFENVYTDTQTMDLVDLAYNKKKNILWVLDQEKGVFAFQVRNKTFQITTNITINVTTPVNITNSTISNNTFKKTINPTTNQTNQTINSTTPTNKTTLIDSNTTTNLTTNKTINQSITKTITRNITRLVLTFTSNRIKKKMCQLMYYSPKQQHLYLSCNKIYKISTLKWPIIDQRVLSHPLINIREIFVQQQKSLLILGGYSVFKVMYLQRTASYFQDQMLDKLTFSKGLAITANQNHLIVLSSTIQSPSILCSTTNTSYLGTHKILIKTTAQCLSQYLSYINYVGQVNQDDKCVYQQYAEIYVWEMGDVPVKPLFIVLLVFAIFVAVMVVWFVLVRFRMIRARKQLYYLNQQANKDNQPNLSEEGNRHQLNQEEPPRTQEFQNPTTQDNQTNYKQTQSNNKSSNNPSKDLYSIQ